MEASTALAGGYFSALLHKYMVNGQLVEKFVLPGQGEVEDPVKIEAAESLAMDLQRIQNLFLLIGNLQRFRDDGAVDLSKNPLNLGPAARKP